MEHATHGKMLRSKSSPKKCVKTANNHSSANTYIFLMKADTLANDDQVEIVKLRHPASNKPAMFAFGSENHTVQEILIFDEKKRSWFINDSVKSDGKLYMSTPIDPIFLVLPYLRKSQLAQPLEQCLMDEDFPDISRVAQCKNLELSLVTDLRGNESLQAFKFNEEKSLKWLQRKIEKVVNVLKQKKIHVSQSAVSATYVTSSKCNIGGTEAEYLKYAHGIVSEYLAEDLSKKLAQHLNIPDETENKKRKLNSSKDEINDKKQKKDLVEESPKVKTTVKELSKPEKVHKSPAPSKKELARQRAAAGSKSITSFFQKK